MVKSYKYNVLNNEIENKSRKIIETIIFLIGTWMSCILPTFLFTLGTGGLNYIIPFLIISVSCSTFHFIKFVIKKSDT